MGPPDILICDSNTLSNPLVPRSTQLRITVTLFLSQSLFGASTILSFTLMSVIAARLSGTDSAAGVRANVDELIGRGGFGSPTLFVGDHMFFGNDRMPLVEFALGQASGRAFVMPGQHGP